MVCVVVCVMCFMIVCGVWCCVCDVSDVCVGQVVRCV